MNDEDEQRLADELIGEAVLSMLKEKEPISLMTLRQQLINMQGQASGQTKYLALDSIINELDRTAKERDARSGRKDTDNRNINNVNQRVKITAGCGKLH